jgi:hypothetical protein
MREAAATVAATGVEPLMSDAAARRQDRAATFRDVVDDTTLRPMLDAIRSATEGKGNSR